MQRVTQVSGSTSHGSPGRVLFRSRDAGVSTRKAVRSFCCDAWKKNYGNLEKDPPRQELFFSALASLFISTAGFSFFSLPLVPSHQLGQRVLL
ncbi:hypothetical protein M431DRAFT_352305 [Trichoderma harzianum CBS 226.95]|uniref:Uncharacterized protein n=1 Tax=Trichoderma harzianum CBS 226.95 TaxID=983964 RepID=A0A2T4ALE0_TRIHA|nr:hypothetical protein M431DRAFT_352305 [Trichoderma harzianum CBS 226.95]PTB57896.1 hypothetical protein M431DRAFT_352305 [Trichoderma harzianum CBS 226.95]